MKRASCLIEQIVDPDNLRLAFWKARKGKNHAQDVEIYRADLDLNLIRLREQILSGLVEVGNYHYFKVYEPKERQICAAPFSERVLHHALMNVCHEHFERQQLSDSYASRKGKGTYAALEQAQRFSCNYRWYLKLDVRQFFGSVHHGVIRKQLGRLFKDPGLLEILGKILDSYKTAGPVRELLPTKDITVQSSGVRSIHASANDGARGLPIGNLTSQYFANHYLSPLDRFIKEALRVTAYVRYMDDMVLWSNEKTRLQNALEWIGAFVEDHLECELKPAQLNSTKQGLPFLGYTVKPYHTRLLGQSKRRFVRKFRNAEAMLDSGDWDQATYQRHLLPLLAFTQHADTTGFRRKVLFEI
ncbi:MAG: reverse transcriptase domain-containing protein [Saprospiraceae bacterium]